jgi:hypothetical protein
VLDFNTPLRRHGFKNCSQTNRFQELTTLIDSRLRPSERGKRGLALNLLGGGLLVVLRFAIREELERATQRQIGSTLPI